MKIAKIWSWETHEVRKVFVKHGSIFASFVFRENPEKSFVKNPTPKHKNANFHVLLNILPFLFYH